MPVIEVEVFGSNRLDFDRKFEYWTGSDMVMVCGWCELVMERTDEVEVG